MRQKVKLSDPNIRPLIRPKKGTRAGIDPIHNLIRESTIDFLQITGAEGGKRAGIGCYRSE